MCLNFCIKQAFLTLCLALGFKKAIKSIIAQPALIMTPIFSFWTFGPVKSDSCCAYKRSEPRICLSFRLTWFNAIWSFCGTFGMVVVHECFISWHPWSSGIFNLFLIAYLPFFALAIICLLLIQFMDKCASCCCRCCKNNCYPMTEKNCIRY